MRFSHSLICLLVLISCGLAIAQPQQTGHPSRIDRKALVARHAVLNTGFDTLGAVSVGNGEFAFTVDPTGLQTFPDYYKHGIPLGTQSQWGWHSVPNPANYKLSEVYNTIEQHGRKVPYTFSVKEDHERMELGKHLGLGLPAGSDDGGASWQTRQSH